MTGTIWCLGMYGSASTWAFNVARMLLEQSGIRPNVHFFSTAEDFADFGQPGTTDLVKSHEIEDDRTILELAKRARKILVTVRDPRDAVASLIQARSHSFERALYYVTHSARLCAGMRGDKRTRLFTYESRFFEDPATVLQIAAHLGLAADANQAQAIFAANARESIERHISRMPDLPGILRDHISGDLLDPYTQWHTHHAGRGGESGRWRQVLDSAQAATVAKNIPLFLAG